ncbi:MAG TPA: CDP-alcohol phosphatidyltransferase family protein [Micromonosporaceae bacterium]
MRSAESSAAERRPGSSRHAAPGRHRPQANAFYAVNRGGGLYSEAVSQRIGAVVAVVADRLGIAPTLLTLVNLVIGVGASAAVVILAPAAAAGDLPAWPLGASALIAWQLAYAIDCADGQLARVTRQTSTAGARVDILADVMVQISLVTALGAAATAYQPDTPAWLVAGFAATWMVNLVTSAMQGSSQAASMITSTTLPVRIVKLIRDYGAVVAFCGLVLTVAPIAMIWVLVVFFLVNGLFLVATVAHAAVHALRPGNGRSEYPSPDVP